MALLAKEANGSPLVSASPDSKVRTTSNGRDDFIEARGGGAKDNARAAGSAPML
jgi:hypothetical protein